MDFILYSVGHGKPNLPSDVALVQRWLNQHLHPSLLANPLHTDGRFSAETESAIKLFQAQVINLTPANGSIDPNDDTFQALSGSPYTSRRGAMLARFGGAPVGGGAQAVGSAPQAPANAPDARTAGFVRSLPVRDWRFCRTSNCRQSDVIFLEQDTWSTRQWLRQFQFSGMHMLSMRNLLWQRSAGDVSHWTDEEVIEHVAGLLASRHVHIHAAVRKVIIDGGSPQGGDAPLSPPVPFPLSGRKRRPAPGEARPRTEIEQPTLPPENDPSSQAAVLVTAARAGVPFCEMCQQQR